MTVWQSADEVVVSVEGLEKSFGEKRALDGLSLSVPRGSITAVLGPNGAGKSTLLEMCEGFQSPDRGRVRVLGLDPVRGGRALRPRIGVMLQEGGAWGGVRAMEMLEHVAKLHANPVDVRMLADRLQLHECGSTPYRRLSGGQKQRVSLAMAVVGRPELLFIDEPTAGLDPEARRRTWELLEEMRGAGVTVVLTSHYLDEVEELADLLYLIDHGRLVMSGTPDEVTMSVNQNRLELTLPERIEPSRVAQLVDALGPEATHTVIERVHRISAPAQTSSLSLVAAWCAENDVLPESLRLGRGRLEDAYLSLIGTRA